MHGAMEEAQRWMVRTISGGDGDGVGYKLSNFYRTILGL
jgi:hypothetical protein